MFPRSAKNSPIFRILAAGTPFQPFAGISLGFVAARPRSLSSTFFRSAAAPVCAFAGWDSEGRSSRFSGKAWRELGWRGRRKRLTPSANNRAPNLFVELSLEPRCALGIAVGMGILGDVL